MMKATIVSRTNTVARSHGVRCEKCACE